MSLCDRRSFYQCHKKIFAKGIPGGAAQEVGDPGERPPRLLVGQQVLICQKVLIKSGQQVLISQQVPICRQALI